MCKKIVSDFIIINETPHPKGALWTTLVFGGWQHRALRLFYPTDNHSVLNVHPGK